MDLFEKTRLLPTQPGVYLYKNAGNAVIYVGKAKNLRARVRNYFAAGKWEDAKTGSLLREAVDIETIVVDSESEALALENTLIKQHQPRFNVLLRDDKTYPYIRLTGETYPRVYVTRRLEKDGSEYFGPYFPAGLAYRLVHFIHKHFLVPSCRVDLTRFHPRPCLQYHIHRCLGPCVEGLVSPERYQEAARDTRLFLAGRQPELARELKQRRDRAASEERFEAAAAFRDLLTVLEENQERQKMHAVEGDDADIAGFHREGRRAALILLHVRRGRMVDRREFFWEDLPDVDLVASGETMGAALKQVYLQQPYVPPRIAIPADFEDRALLQEALAAQRGAAVELSVPQRGARKAMLELAAKNAQNSFVRRFRAASAAALTAERLRRLAERLELGLPPDRPLRRIECFDISHFQGAATVAAMVVWEGAGMRKADYRKFGIREVEGVDDFKSMAEVVTRRYRRLLESGKPMPELVLVDGGLGQLHAAERALEALGVTGQALAAIAKREELIYVAGHESRPVRLDQQSPELHIVQAIRDEAHRFAITFHRQRRGQATLRSELLTIPGVGPATGRRLLRHFGSLAAVRAAPREALQAVVAAPVATAIWTHFHSQGAAVV